MVKKSTDARTLPLLPSPPRSLPQLTARRDCHNPCSRETCIFLRPSVVVLLYALRHSDRPATIFDQERNDDLRLLTLE